VNCRLIEPIAPRSTFHLPRIDFQHDLVGAAEDRGEAAVLMAARDRRLLRQPLAAKGLRLCENALNP
jgi:hypothetical protein